MLPFFFSASFLSSVFLSPVPSPLPLASFLSPVGFAVVVLSSSSKMLPFFFPASFLSSVFLSPVPSPLPLASSLSPVGFAVVVSSSVAIQSDELGRLVIFLQDASLL